MQPVQVVAHRGSSGVVAEHTLAAYELALDEGADALECDVRLTRDGVLVCVHDRRVERTSDGRGVVSTLELAELSAFDFASWKDEDPLLTAAWEQADVDHERRTVLTFDRLLELVVDGRGPTGAPVHLNVETKHPTRYGGLVERTLVERLQHFGLDRPISRSVSRVSVMSFASTALRRVHLMAPTLPTVLLMDWVLPRYRDGSLPRSVSGAGFALGLLKQHPRLVERVHDHGHRVLCFTADEPPDIDLLLDLGVDAVITNHPRRARRLVDGRAAAPRG